MPKAKSSGGDWYAVARGKQPGLYATWTECEAQVKGFTNSRYKKFHSRREAEEWVKNPDQPSASTSKAKVKSESTDATLEESGWDVVYSDGASKENGRPTARAGVGVWWGHNHPRNISERCPGEQTNNRAELLAIIRILETTYDLVPRPLLIKSDSKYSMSCVNEWLPGWRNRGFVTSSGDPPKNLPLITYLDCLLDERKALGQTVKMKYVKGHSGNEGNDGADRMANIGSQIPEIPKEPDWNAKERDIRRKIDRMRANPSLRDVPSAGPSRRASVIEPNQPAPVVSTARSSREILSSSTSADPRSKATSASASAPVSPGRARSSFRPYGLLSVSNATSSRAGGSKVPERPQAGSSSTAKAHQPGYQPTRSIRLPGALGVVTDVDHSHPYYRVAPPDEDLNKTMLYRDVATMTATLQKEAEQSAASHVEMSKDELKQYEDNLMDNADLELELEMDD